MKPFRFSLESVLQVRLRECEKARLAFGEALRFREQAEAALTRAQEELEACQQRLLQRREGRSSRNDQLLLLNAVQYQQSLCQRLKSEVVKLEREAEARRAGMLVAQRKYEAIAELKKKQNRVHRQNATREEESALNDLINARFVLRAREVRK